MKKVLFFAALLMSFRLFAFDTSLNYGINKQTSPEEYQQYIGKEFKFRPAYGMLETWDKSGFKYSEEYADVPFTITKVTVKDVELNKKPNKEIQIEAVQTGEKKKVKFKGYEDVSVKMGFWGDVKQWPLIGHMPIYFTEPFSEFTNSKLGTLITNPVVKDKYKIISVHFGKGDATGVLCYKAKNQRTGEVKACYADKTDEVFDDALKGKYATALIKIEKPEDTSDRYSNSIAVTDENVGKYSYSDSIINIIISGNQEQFNFELKNVSPSTLKIIWDEAAFVGLDGSTSNVMHVGTKYSERNSSQPPTTIIKGAKIDDLACPTANVYYDEGTRIGYSTYGNGWKTHPMLPQTYKGKEAGEIRLMLPIQVKDVVNEYTFVFKVYYKYDHPELLNHENL